MHNAQYNYQRQEILNASPEELIGKLYDYAIQACYQKRQRRLQDILQTLAKSLNFDYEISGTLFELYDYCQRCAQQNEFEEVRVLIEDLRNTWNEHVVKSKKIPKRKESKGFVV